jgi:cysteinyl-tRNA synthetase
MSAVRRWGIQLRYLNRKALAESPFDMIVIDHAPHPKQNVVEMPFTGSDIEPLKRKPEGARRLVLAYLSIGEAERYRYYWKPEWDAPQTRPAWLGMENPNWPGDYQVTFSNPEWQRIIFGTPDSYLDRITAAGFDGIYLDRVDAYQDVEEASPGAADDMTRFVVRLADYARRINPSFLIVMQNAEELLTSRTLSGRLDAIAKEDLMYGFGNTETANPPPMLRGSLSYLRRGKRQGLTVFVLEYVTAPEKISAVRALAEREGFVMHLTERLLGTLSVEPPVAAGQVAPPTPAAGDPR